MRAALAAVGFGLCLTAAAMGCSEDSNPGGEGGAGTGASGSTGSGAGATTSTGTGTGTGGAGGVACVEGLTSTSIAVGQSPGAEALYAAVRPDGSTVVAWSGGGSVWLTELTPQGQRKGDDLTVAGAHVHGLAVTATETAVTVARGTDELWFVKLDAGGQVAAEARLTGASDHNTVGSEWYDYSPTFAAEGGRLAAMGAGFVAYFPIFRRWPDMIAHTGDTLRYLDGSGNAQGGGWDWGCSHSLDVRLAQSSTTLAPVCLSDCYAQKAILFEDSTVISSEPSGNCAGLSDARLGGLVAVSNGFWLSYASPEGRSSRDIAVVQLGLDGAPGQRVWLTADAADDDSPHLAPLGQGLLAGWRSGGTYYLAHLDGAGQPVGAPKTIDGAFREDDDFLAYPNGDVGWVGAQGSELVVYRYGGCTAP